MGGSHPSQGPVSFSLSLCLFKGKESHLLLRGSVCQLWIIIQILKAAHEGQPAVTGGPESLKTNLGVSMGFRRQEYWSGLPFLSLGDLPNPGIEPRSPALQADSLPSEPPGKPNRDK